jgi:hypothetical protein
MIALSPSRRLTLRDQIVPYADLAPLSAKLVKGAVLKTYKGFPHGMPTTNADQINADLLDSLSRKRTTWLSGKSSC